jgi:hypothetical protein
LIEKGVPKGTFLELTQREHSLHEKETNPVPGRFWAVGKKYALSCISLCSHKKGVADTASPFIDFIQKEAFSGLSVRNRGTLEKESG